MKNNVFVENIAKICEISREQNVDMEIATIIFAKNEKLTDYTEDKQAFDKMYIKWYNSSQQKTFEQYVSKPKRK